MQSKVKPLHSWFLQKFLMWCLFVTDFYFMENCGAYSQLILCHLRWWSQNTSSSSWCQCMVEAMQWQRYKLLHSYAYTKFHSISAICHSFIVYCYWRCCRCCLVWCKLKSNWSRGTQCCLLCAWSRCCRMRWTAAVAGMSRESHATSTTHQQSTGKQFWRSKPRRKQWARNRGNIRAASGQRNITMVLVW